MGIIGAIGTETNGMSKSMGLLADLQKKKQEEGSVAYASPILSFPPSTEASAVRGRGEQFNAIG